MANSAWSGNTAGLASATSAGLVGTGAQTFAGKKTLDGGAAIKGDTSGVAIAAGYVGEQIGTLRNGTGGFTYSVQSTTTVPATTPTSVISQVLNKGFYLITFKTQCFSNLATGALLATFRIGGTAVTQNLICSSSSTITGYISATIPTIISADSTTVAVYANVDTGGITGGNLHEMWIVRLD